MGKGGFFISYGRFTMNRPIFSPVDICFPKTYIFSPLPLTRRENCPRCPAGYAN